MTFWQTDFSRTLSLVIAATFMLVATVSFVTAPGSLSCLVGDDCGANVVAHHLS